MMLTGNTKHMTLHRLAKERFYFAFEGKTSGADKAKITNKNTSFFYNSKLPRERKYKIKSTELP